MAVTAEADGWEAVRFAVLVRDRHRCVAVTAELWKGIEVTLAQDECRDMWGIVQPRLRLDHVDMFSTFLRKAPDSEAFLQSVCDLHHDRWVTANRHASRERLASLYPEEWAEWIAR